MSGRTVRRFVEGLLRGQPTARARPDDFEARQMKTAIELRAARLGGDSPREEFVTDLHRRLAGSADETPSGTRRQVVLGTSIAAASVAAGIVVDRTLLRGAGTPPPAAPAQGVVEPNTGAWRPVGASADVADGGTLAFDLGTVRGFVHRVDTQTRGGLGDLHTSGLPAVAGCAGEQVAVPLSCDVVLRGGLRDHPPDADSSSAAAPAAGARGRRGHRGFRPDGTHVDETPSPLVTRWRGIGRILAMALHTTWALAVDVTRGAIC